MDIELFARSQLTHISNFLFSSLSWHPSTFHNDSFKTTSRALSIMSSPIALRISQLKPIVRSFPRSPLSEPTQISEAWVSILDRTLASDAAASTSSQANSSQATLAALREAGQQQRLVQFKASVERLKAGNAMRDVCLMSFIMTAMLICVCIHSIPSLNPFLPLPMTNCFTLERETPFTTQNRVFEDRGGRFSSM